MPKFNLFTARICGAVLIANFAISASSVAETDATDDQAIDEIVVVAHKHARAVRNIAANVTVVSNTTIADTLSTTMADVFRYTPGVDVQTAGTRFGGEGINIRGIGGNRVAVLLDGVPLSDQFDVGSFSNATRDFINAGLVDNVEVLHGPASALYGSSAIGGVVAARTPDPARYLTRNSIGGDLSATYKGADGSLHSTGVLAFGNQHSGFLIGGSVRDGEQTNSAAVEEALDTRDYRRQSALAKYVANDSYGNAWRIGLVHQDASVQSSTTSMLGAGRYRSTTALEGDDDYSMDLLSAELDFGGSQELFDAGLIRGYYKTADIRQSTLDERGLASRPVSIDRYFEFDQTIGGLEINLQKSVSGRAIDHQLGFGIEYRQKTTEEYRDGLESGMDDGLVTNVLLGEVFPLRDFPISESSEWGAYIEDAMAIGDWTVIAAIRADSYSLRPQVDTMYEEDYPFADPVSLSESDLSPKLGLIYHISQGAEIYLQYSHGFRAPPYEDANIGLEIPLFNYRAVPNPDLKSESSDGLDLGLRWRGARANFRIGVFHTRYDDFIESKVRIGIDTDSGRLLFQSQNIDETVIQGIEGGGQVALSGLFENMSIDGSFYFARGENKVSGEPLNSVGPGQLTAGLLWSSRDGTRSARLQGLFTQPWSTRDESFGELFKPAGSAVFDFYVSQRIGERTTARFGVLNLTDSTYWHWSDVRGLSPTDPAIPFLAQAGRSISVSLSLNWQ